MDNDCNNAIALMKNGESMACGLIAEEDKEFGSVFEVPLKHEEQVKEALSIDTEQIKHISAEQQEQLLTVLNQDRFTEKTGLCTLVEHEIELKPNFRVKEFRICFNRPSTSRMASPLAIIKKKDGSLQLVCDYKYINSFTIARKNTRCLLLKLF